MHVIVEQLIALKILRSLQVEAVCSGLHVDHPRVLRKLQQDEPARETSVSTSRERQYLNMRVVVLPADRDQMLQLPTHRLWTAYRTDESRLIDDRPESGRALRA
ncbi:hypothetical protein J0910_04790 [Nocardiopsis sp. CNT-189]